ncbi:hypothetical protein L6452_10393 [Arctium lappa]|uniref:Uncharacterized protein n=1 Tax=Arctium lappa TaxID=4217 RepID=A0ACB9DMH5_ARCLA|nr:hypothetical protein L6452_10393 [Arctium lappa]
MIATINRVTSLLFEVSHAPGFSSSFVSPPLFQVLVWKGIFNLHVPGGTLRRKNQKGSRCQSISSFEIFSVKFINNC